MFKFLGRLAAKRPWTLCGAWVLLGAVVALIAPAADRRMQDDDIRFLPDRCDSVRGYRLLEKAFPQDVFASKVIFAIERSDSRLTEADLRLVDALIGDLNQLRQDEPALQINRICSFRDPFIGHRLLSKDGQCILIQVALGTPYLALQTRTTVDRAEQVVRARMAQCDDPPLLHATGPAGIGRDLIQASGDSLENTTLATILLVVFILLLVYRAPLMALVPLVTIAGSVWVALKLMALCTLIPGFYLVNISQVFAVVMLYGAGTDYCLFLISRYKEELAHGIEPGQALARSVGTVGGALAASAGTVICGLGLMGLAEFAKVRCGGPAIAISLAVALAASLTLAPALLRLLGPVAFWPCRGWDRSETVSQRRRRAVTNHGLWAWISRQVVTHPGMVFAASVLLLAPLALVGLGVRSNYRATGELSPSSSSVRGLEVIQHHFTAGEIGVVNVLLVSGHPWDSLEGRHLISHLSQCLSQVENVAEVRSWTQPLGTPLAEPLPTLSYRPRDPLTALMHHAFGAVEQEFTSQFERTTRDVYLAKINEADGSPRYVARLDVVPGTDPFDPRSVPTLEAIQVWLRDVLPRLPGMAETVQAECYGVTVNARDLAQVTESDRLRINTLVMGGIFLILLVLVRRPSLAGYLLVTVLFSYYATLGATTLSAHWFGGRPLGEVDWRVPFFLFTILVAVGEDYNILLISRAIQERKRHGAEGGIRRALAATGGTITSCGLIMAGTFATLMLAGLNTLIQIGFALAFGVILDTFVVRPLLVPAFTLWMWKREEGKMAAPKTTLQLPRRTWPIRRAG
jgi:RND superfamily putative drug exporter